MMAQWILEVASRIKATTEAPVPVLDLDGTSRTHLRAALAEEIVRG